MVESNIQYTFLPHLDGFGTQKSQLARAIHLAIVRGIIRPGEMLPQIRDLMEIYKVDRVSASGALSLLSEMKVVQRQRCKNFKVTMHVRQIEGPERGSTRWSISSILDKNFSNYHVIEMHRSKTSGFSPSSHLTSEDDDTFTEISALVTEDSLPTCSVNLTFNNSFYEIAPDAKLEDVAQLNIIFDDTCSVVTRLFVTDDPITRARLRLGSRIAISTMEYEVSKEGNMLSLLRIALPSVSAVMLYKTPEKNLNTTQILEL